MYTMNTPDVEIIDEGYFIFVLNKKTGASARAKNHCGYVNHRMSFSISYSGKPTGLAVIVSGRPDALNECLRLVDLPSYRTLKKREGRSLDAIIQSASTRAAESNSTDTAPVKKSTPER